MKVFLSYAANDRNVAEGLIEGLEAGGLEVVDPRREARAGKDAFEWTAKALGESQAMVFVISPHAIESEWSKRELEYAMTEPRFQGRLVPVLARPTKDIPWILRKLEMLDAQSGSVQAGQKASELIKRSPSERRRIFGS